MTVYLHAIARTIFLVGAIILLATELAFQSVHAQTYSRLFEFPGGLNGKHPVGGVVRDQVGNLYGTTYDGGIRAPYGNVYKLDTAGRLTILHAFAGGEDGAAPYYGVTMDSEGNLYGTTQYGGSLGFGTVFKIDSGGTKTVVYSFQSLLDGGYPNTRLLVDEVGNLYGTTSVGGDSTCATYGCGTVFKLDQAGTKTVLYSFVGGTDGVNPAVGLTRDAVGNLYGATQNGGDPACENGCGILFRIDPNGNETVLYRFTGGTDGYSPNGDLLIGAGGNIYGMTQSGGDPKSSGGTVFKVDPSGIKTIVHNFLGGAYDGNTPYGGLIGDAAGNLYGVNAYGCYRCAIGQGQRGQHLGSVFKFDSDGNETILHIFSAHIQQDPRLAIDAAGNLYGTTEGGGLYSKGVIYQLIQ